MGDMSSAIPVCERWQVAPGSELTGGTEAILLVEDEAFVREVTSEVLTSAGYRVFAAKNAAEGLAAPERMGGVDLLLTDVVLPGKNGRALAEDLRSLQPNVLVLFTTGYAAFIGELETAEPAEECLPKPFSADALLRKVRQMLDARNDSRNKARNELRTNASLTRAYGNG